MKRYEQLKKLSREHHGSLSMAKKIAEIVVTGNDSDLLQAMNQVQQYYNDELESHFQHEEQTLFSIIFQNYAEHRDIATALLKEHGQIRVLVQGITMATAKKDLAEFALLLKDHTRVEERQLFPVVQEVFTSEQLDDVLNYLPIE